VSSEYRPDAEDVRAIRPFKMTDDELEPYVDLAETSSYAPATAIAIPNTSRKHAWALLAAHLATVMREPEPTSVRVGPVTTEWSGVRGASAALTTESLELSAPGKEFKANWRNWSRVGYRFL
jgi:hypothetical protein